MKNIFSLIISVALLYPLNTIACTPDEFNDLDRQLSAKQAAYFNEKSNQLDALLQKIQTEKNLSDKELLAYRFESLNTPAAKKIHDKDKKLTIGDMFQMAQEKDCKKLQEWSDDSTESANKQWAIVFKKIERDLQTASKK